MWTATDWYALWLSLKVAFMSLVLIAGPGLAMGWLLARKSFAGKAILETLVHAPLVMPPVITGYLLLLLLGREGPLGVVLHALGIPLVFHINGAVLAAAVMSFPLLVRSVRLGIELVDPKLEIAAATLGASPRRVFLTVTLPLARSGLVTGFVLAFARGLGEFGATIVLAGNIEGVTQTIPLAVYTYMQQPGGEGPALGLALVSVGLALGALLFSEWSSRKLNRQLEARS